MRQWSVVRWVLGSFLLLAARFAAAARPTIDLDGPWQFRFASADRGISEHWQNDSTPFDQTVAVPGCWDQQGIGNATDKMRHNAVGVGWYRRSFTAPPGWRGRRVWLYIGGVHRSAVVFVNGQKVDEHYGYPVAIRLDITDKLANTAEQSLVVAVDSRQQPAHDALFGTFDLADFMNVDWGGIFEHVRLESTADSWIDDAFVAPDPEHDIARLQLAFGGDNKPGTYISYQVEDEAHRVLVNDHAAMTQPGLALVIPLKNAPRWSPAEPHLLTLSLEMRRGDEVLDSRTIRFGLRRLETRNAQFVLNGDLIFLRGYGDDFNFARELLPPADVQYWKTYLQKRKDFGFNFVRHHSMMPTESYLQAADEVGMLVQPELPIAYMENLAKATPEGVKLYAKVWEQYIRQMRNHPCIAAWCMGNEEVYGEPFAPEFYSLAKTLDPTRLVIDSDGVWPNLDRPTLDYRSQAFSEWALPWGPSRNKYAVTASTKPVIVHEMGNLSCLPDPAEAKLFDGTIKPFWLDAMQEAVQRQHLESELSAMLKASWQLQASLLKLNLEAARLGPNVCGYEQWLFRDYWTQSTGIESIVGTTRALTAEDARVFNADAVLLWDHDHVNFRCGEEIPLRMVLSDYRPAASDAIDKVTVHLDDESAELQKPSQSPSRGAIGLWAGSLRVPNVTAPTKMMLTATAGAIHNQWPIWIWPEAPQTPHQVVIAPHLTKDLLDKLDNGANVLLLDEINLPSQNATFKPAWWRGDQHSDFCYGNYFATHPAVSKFPQDGYGDLQCYRLLNNRAVTVLDLLPGNVKPIVWAIDVPWSLRRMAYLWEAKVGRGKLLVSNFDLSAAARQADPAAEWMLALLTRYADSTEFEPKATVPEDWLSKVVDQSSLPDAANCINGFDQIVRSTEHATWFTHREASADQFVAHQSDSQSTIVWRTAALPANWSQPNVTFVWAGGMGYHSEIDAGPFELSVNGKPLCAVSFTMQSMQWPCTDGKSILHYDVLKRTDQDTAGLFFLTVPAASVAPGKSVQLSLAAKGQHSHRWIAVAPYRDAIADLQRP